MKAAAAPIEVRPATAADLNDVAMIAAEGWRNAYRGLISAPAIEETLARWYASEVLQSRLSGGGLDVAERESRVVGFVQHGPLDAQVHEVFAIYALPSLIGQGVGCAMWQRVAGAARLAGRTSIELWVLKGNQLGTDWYERQGGVVVTYREVELPDGAHAELRYRFSPTPG